LAKEGYDVSTEATAMLNAKRPMKCSACGLPGHIKKNPLCPMHAQSLEQFAELDQEVVPSEFKLQPAQNVAVKGSRLRISGKALRRSGFAPLAPSTPSYRPGTPSTAAASSTSKETPSLKFRVSSGVVRRGAQATPLERRHNLMIKPSEAGAAGAAAAATPDSAVSGAKRRRRHGRGANPRLEFQVLLERILARLVDEPCSVHFRQPVSADTEPDYASEIPHAMDLGTMRKKVKEFGYLDRFSFTQDVELIVQNARTFCHARYPGMLLLAQQLLDIFYRLVRRQTSRMDMLSAEILADLPVNINRDSAAPTATVAVAPPPPNQTQPHEHTPPTKLPRLETPAEAETEIADALPSLRISLRVPIE
jgi:Bromodomain